MLLDNSLDLFEQDIDLARVGVVHFDNYPLLVETRRRYG